jgi:predicted esterase
VRDTQEKRSILGQIFFAIRLGIVTYSLLLLASGIWVGVTVRTLLLLILQSVATFGLASPVPKYRLALRRTIGGIALACLGAAFFIYSRSTVVPPRRGEFISASTSPLLSIDGVAPEQDLVAIASGFFPLIGGLSLSEARNLLPETSRLYAAMYQERGHYTSALVSSMVEAPLLSRIRGLVFRSADGVPSRRAIVFLHGTGGNIGLLCWIVSKAAESIGADTYCPSLGVLGMWGSDRGRDIVRNLITSLGERGTTEIYLVGVSAGAVGAALLTQEFAPHLRGVALINGAHPAIRNAKIPVLLLYSQQDERFPPRLLRWIAQESAKRNTAATIEEVEGDHLYALKQVDGFTTRLKAWLQAVARKAREN